MSEQHGSYYLPKPSVWPIIGSIALFCTMIGAANWLHENPKGPMIFASGLGILFIMMFGWFGTVIRESLAGKYDPQVDRSFRLGMIWFIFTEVCFFGAFFGALAYIRLSSVPALAGSAGNQLTHLLLWPNFKSLWPLLSNPDNAQFIGPKSVMETWGLPALNTLILLTSGATVTWAHFALLKNKRLPLIIGLTLTVALGILFLCCQAHEYVTAYTHKGLTLGSGIYGTTFFMLTGFHGLHVTLGTIMLITILIRSLFGHFDSHHHFAFEAVSWYWHFVDVVWLGLFIFVYWL